MILIACNDLSIVAAELKVQAFFLKFHLIESAKLTKLAVVIVHFYADLESDTLLR
jgi:hypothetical protein